jgi:hypothetical protein
MLADDMAAELLRLQRQNLQTTRDHIAALTQLGLLERRAGRALRVALAEPVAAELDRGMAQAVDDLLRVAAGFVRDGTDDMEQTGLAHALPEISGADASAGFHVLLVSRAGEPDQRIALGTEPLVIGRAPSNGLILVAHEVSRAHCRVALVANEVNVTDLDSTNGTYVDGKRIAHTTVLLPGAVLQVGPYRMICQPLANQDVEGTMRPIAPAMPVAVSDGAP